MLILLLSIVVLLWLIANHLGQVALRRGLRRIPCCRSRQPLRGWAGRREQRAAPPPPVILDVTPEPWWRREMTPKGWAVLGWILAIGVVTIFGLMFEVIDLGEACAAITSCHARRSGADPRRCERGRAQGGL